MLFFVGANCLPIGAAIEHITMCTCEGQFECLVVASLMVFAGGFIDFASMVRLRLIDMNGRTRSGSCSGGGSLGFSDDVFFGSKLTVAHANKRPNATECKALNVASD